MKSNKQVASYPAKKLLASHSTGNIVSDHTQFQLGRYIHACTYETHSLANLQDLFPTLAGIIINSTNQLK